MANFSLSLCEEFIRTEGRCGLTKNETMQMAHLALRALKDENPWKRRYMLLLATSTPGFAVDEATCASSSGSLSANATQT